jgi:hypothetical protein
MNPIQLLINILTFIYPYLKKPGCTEVMIIPSLLIFGSAFSQNINVKGTIKGSHYNNNLADVTVYLIKNLNNTIVDSTTTDAEGKYNMNVVWTKKNKYDHLEDKLYPNPYLEQTNIILSVEESDNYRMLVTSADGKELLKTSLKLTQGNNNITLNGGDAGLHTITITNDKTKKSYKAIQKTSTNSPITYDVTTADESKSNFKSVEEDILMIGDEATIKVVNKNNSEYLNADTSFIISPSQTINKTMEQIPHTFTTTLKPYLEDGTSVLTLNLGFYVNIDWTDETKTYPVNNEVIQIVKDIYRLPNGSLGFAWISNDTSGADGVLNWSIGRRPKQVTNRANPYQNETTGPLEPEYKTQMPLDSLDEKIIHHYLIRKRAETQPGQFEALNSFFSGGLITSSGGGIGASTFIDLKKYGVADSLDLVRFGFNLDSGLPNTPEDQEKLDSLFQLAINTRYFENGDTLLPPHRIYTIANFSDPRWQEVVARGYENVVSTYFYNGTPENSRAWSFLYTYNGKPRLKNTSANYNNVNNDAQIFEENFSAITGEEEGVGGLAPWIWNATTSQPSQYAKSISTIPAILNLGTGQ